MKWQKHGSCGGKYGRISGNYSIGKVFWEGATLYELWHNNTLIKTCESFEDADEFATNHEKEHGRS
jgi:hypothetical protein